MTRAVSVTPSVVVHLAAAVPGGSVPDDEITAAATRRIDAAVAAACRKWNSRVLYMSGANLYNRRDPNWKIPESVVEGAGPYLAAKLDGERLFRHACEAAVFRLSSPIGIGIRADLVFMRFLQAARAHEALQVWGSGSREQDCWSDHIRRRGDGRDLGIGN